MEIVESDMELIAKVVHKCFKIQERGISVGQDLEVFVGKIEVEIERLTDEDVGYGMP